MEDGRRLLTGDGVYVDDLQLPEMLYTAFVRSPHAHARVRAIDPVAARAVPGVVAICAAEDLGAANAPLPMRFHHPGLRNPKMPHPLAAGVARFVGEPVAVVVADSRYGARDAAGLVEVDYEVLPAVASLQASRADGAPRVHDGSEGNIAGAYRWRIGDPDGAFRAASVTLSVRLSINRGTAVPIEPRGCVALYDPALGFLTVWASTQNPHYLQRTIAVMLAMPEERVRVLAPDVGGAFGVKGGAPREYVVVAAMAVRTGRPVKWIEERSEHFIACQQDRDQVHHLEVAATREGELLGLRDLFWLDVGAYAMAGHLIGIHTTDHMIGPYRLPNLDVNLESAYTHRVPTGAYRGAGRPQGAYVIERVMDHLARALRLDPAEVRRRNLIPPEVMPWDTGLRQPDGTAVQYDSGDYPRVLQTALDAFDYPAWRAEQQRRRAADDSVRLGIGLALYVEETAAHGHESVTLQMDATGRVAMVAGPPSQGQGLAPVLGRIVGRELSIPPAWVHVAAGDTSTVADSYGAHGSRVATLVGNATALAARDMGARLRTLAAQALDGAPDEVELRDGRAALRGDANGIAYGELIRRMAPDGAGITRRLEVTAGFAPTSPAWSTGAHLVAVEVDADTGIVHILRYLIVHDSGTVLDEEAVRRQILGGVVQGIGGSLYERLVYDEFGQPLVTTLADYAMPRAGQVPPIDIVRLETPSPLNPLGLKGAGESGCMAAYAALAAAVEDALAAEGLAVRALPLTAAEIWEMLRHGAAERAGESKGSKPGGHTHGAGEEAGPIAMV
ncbi:MAG: xanthine dehydrogenase family protein molybdopterin-binding subunit [Armatimonadota bacterium]